MQKPKDEQELERWFAANRMLLENAYTAAELPWQQSGFGLHSTRTVEHWTAYRKPIADAVQSSGTFLDIGCANGYLLESLLRWTRGRGLSIIPFGLDFSARLVALAKERLPAYADHIFIGNAWDWSPPRTFDYVRTELVYVPDELQREYVTRLLDRYLPPGGRLLAAEYRARENSQPHLSIDAHLTTLGFTVDAVHSGYWEGREMTRVAVVTKGQ